MARKVVCLLGADAAAFGAGRVADRPGGQPVQGRRGQCCPAGREVDLVRAGLAGDPAERGQGAVDCPGQVQAGAGGQELQAGRAGAPSEVLGRDLGAQPGRQLVRGQGRPRMPGDLAAEPLVGGLVIDAAGQALLAGQLAEPAGELLRGQASALQQPPQRGTRMVIGHFRFRPGPVIAGCDRVVHGVSFWAGRRAARDRVMAAGRVSDAAAASLTARMGQARSSWWPAAVVTSDGGGPAFIRKRHPRPALVRGARGRLLVPKCAYTGLCRVRPAAGVTFRPCSI
jgi:hypothetical protein